MGQKRLRSHQSIAKLREGAVEVSGGQGLMGWDEGVAWAIGPIHDALTCCIRHTYQFVTAVVPNSATRQIL